MSLKARAAMSRLALILVVAAGVIGATGGCTSEDSTEREDADSSTPTTTTTTTTAAEPFEVTDEEAIATAEEALVEEGVEPDDMEERVPLVVRSDDTVEVSFPHGPDQDPVIGGEPHVVIDAVTGEAQEVFLTR